MSRELFEMLLQEMEPVAQQEESGEEAAPERRYQSLKRVLAARYKQGKDGGSPIGNQQTQVISQLRQGGSGQSRNQLHKMLKDNPQWINNLMGPQPKLGSFLTNLYRCLSCRI